MPRPFRQRAPASIAPPGFAVRALRFALAAALVTSGPAALVPSPILAGPGTVPSAERRTSLGFMAGEPSGVTLRVMSPRNEKLAWEMGLGWSMAVENAMQFHAQHQWHLVTLSDTTRGVGTFYLGAGGRVKHIDGTRFGFRGAAGFVWITPQSPRTRESFVEIAPIVDLTPDNDLSLSVTVGMRWYLKVGSRS